MRGIFPEKSRAACLKDYELFFGMENGFAAARQDPGNEMHGVVHRITKNELAILDKIEVWYERDLVEVTPYQGDELEKPVNAYVYVFIRDEVKANPDRFAPNPPQERYRDILLEGAQFHGVKQSFVESKIQNIKYVPRKSIETLRVFQVPSSSLPTWTLEIMSEKDKEDKNMIYVALKNKIIRFDLTNLTDHTQILKRDRGTHWSFLVGSKYIYDPKYGVPASPKEMKDEHYKVVEDLILDSIIIGEISNRWEMVAFLD